MDQGRVGAEALEGVRGSSTIVVPGATSPWVFTVVPSGAKANSGATVKWGCYLRAGLKPRKRGECKRHDICK